MFSPLACICYLVKPQPYAGKHWFSPWHISSLVASSAIQSWRVCNTKLRRKFKKREGGLVQKKPEPRKGKENTLPWETLTLCRRSLEQTYSWNLESGAPVRSITAFLSQKVDNKKLFAMEKSRKNWHYDRFIIMCRRKIKMSPCARVRERESSVHSVCCVCWGGTGLCRNEARARTHMRTRDSSPPTYKLSPDSWSWSVCSWTLHTFPVLCLFSVFVKKHCSHNDLYKHGLWRRPIRLEQRCDKLWSQR